MLGVTCTPDPGALAVHHDVEMGAPKRTLTRAVWTAIAKADAYVTPRFTLRLSNTWSLEFGSGTASPRVETPGAFRAVRKADRDARTRQPERSPSWLVYAYRNK